MKNRVLKYTGYALFGILFFLLLIYIRFPDEKVKAWIITSFENNLPYDLTIKKLQPVFLIGLCFKDVEIATDVRDKNAPVFRATGVKARLQILPLFVGHLNFKYEIGAYNGTVRGIAKLKRGTKGIKASLSAVIHEIEPPTPLISDRNIGFVSSGKVEGKLNVVVEDFNAPVLSGDAILSIENGKIKGIRVRGIRVREISYNGIDCSFELVRDKMDLKKLSLRGEDVEINIAGKILLAKEIGKSHLLLKLQLKPKKGFERKYRPVFRLVKTLRDKKGYFSLPISGTLKSPKVVVP